MPQPTAFLLSDLFRDLRELAGTCTSLDMQATGSSLQDLQSATGGGIAGDKVAELRNLLGEEQSAGVLDFWREEWIME